MRYWLSIHWPPLKGEAAYAFWDSKKGVTSQGGGFGVNEVGITSKELVRVS